MSNKDMTFKEYSDAILKEPIFNQRYALEYLTMSLAGETGEFVEKVKRLYRKGDPYDVTGEEIEEMLLELGDVLWAIVWLSDYLGVSIESVALMNIDKLNDRIRNGTLDGKGDKR